MKAFLAFLALIASVAGPAQAVSISGTFTGAVSSGREIVYPFFADPVVTDLAGRTFVLNTDIDLADPDHFNSLRMYLTGGGQSGVGVEEDLTAAFTSSYSKGVLRLTFGGGASGNDSGLAVLFADLVDRQLVNWRGTLTIQGQTGIGYDWNMQATMPTLTFVGTYAGPIPEPATWALMLGGFGLVGAAGRRQKVTVAYA